MTEQPQQPSIGGDVADFLGNLGRLETGETYGDSMNPLGDPFSGLNSPKELVEKFAETHPNDLEILYQRLNDFCQIGKSVDQTPPPVYLEAKQAIQEQLSKQKD